MKILPVRPSSLKAPFCALLALFGAGVLSVQAAPQLTLDSVPTVGAIGNSICRNQYTPREWGGLLGTNLQWTPFGAFVFFACDGIAVPEVHAFEGHSGKTSWEIADLMLPKSATESWGVNQKMPSGIAAFAPNITVIIASTNDLLLASPSDVHSGRALEKALEGLRGNIQYVRSIGSIPVVCNILPIEGLTALVPGASIPDELTGVVPAWNAEIEDLCKTEDVWYCDVFSACAREDGSNRWKDGYVYRQGSEVEGGPENSWKVHPSQLASLAIAREALGPVLKKIIGTGTPKVPASDADGNVAPSLESWKVDYDPQANSSFDTVSADGRNVLHFRKPAQTGSGYASWTSGEIDVTPGEVFLYAAGLRLVTTDNRVSAGFSIADRTPGSASRGQPLTGIGVDEGFAPKGIDTGVFRAAGVFTIPAGVTKICASVNLNRSGGGSADGEDQAFLDDLAIIPLSVEKAKKYQPAP